MEIEIFERGNELVVIPVNQIKSMRWDDDTLILSVESSNLVHSFMFKSSEEGLDRFDEIVENILNL